MTDDDFSAPKTSPGKRRARTNPFGVPIVRDTQPPPVRDEATGKLLPEQVEYALKTLHGRDGKRADQLLSMEADIEYLKRALDLALRKDVDEIKEKIERYEFLAKAVKVLIGVVAGLVGTLLYLYDRLKGR